MSITMKLTAHEGAFNLILQHRKLLVKRLAELYQTGSKCKFLN